MMLGGKAISGIRWFAILLFPVNIYSDRSSPFIVILIILMRDSFAQVSHQSIKIIVSGGVGRERDKWRLQRLTAGPDQFRAHGGYD